MERQEPTIGKPDMQDLHFRPRSHRGIGTSHDSGSGLWLKAGLAIVALLLMAMGLIEWNARRQAAAMTAELMRPMTPAEETRFNEQMRRWERELEAETAKDLAAVQRHLRVVPQVQRHEPRAPLRPGQRCMQGRRLERIEGGWRDLPNEPC